MGKVEILSIIAGIVLAIAISLIVVPSLGNTVETVKAQSISNEITTIRKSAKSYVLKSSNGDYKDINAKDMEVYVPGLKIGGGTGTDSFFISDIENNIKYKIESDNNNQEFKIQVQGIKDYPKYIDRIKKDFIENSTLTKNTNHKANWGNDDSNNNVIYFKD